jgi:hypothetical protein
MYRCVTCGVSVHLMPAASLLRAPGRWDAAIVYGYWRVWLPARLLRIIVFMRELRTRTYIHELSTSNFLAGNFCIQ